MCWSWGWFRGWWRREVICPVSSLLVPIDPPTLGSVVLPELVGHRAQLLCGPPPGALRHLVGGRVLVYAAGHRCADLLGQAGLETVLLAL